MAEIFDNHICRICHLIHVNEIDAEDVIQNCGCWRQRGRGRASLASLHMRFPAATAATALLKPRRRRALLAACSSDRNACGRRRAAHSFISPRAVLSRDRFSN